MLSAPCRNQQTFAIKCLKSLSLVAGENNKERNSNLLAQILRHKQNDKTKTSRKNFTFEPSYGIDIVSFVSGFAEKKRQKFSLWQSKMIDLCVVKSWMGNRADMTGQMITTVHSSFVWVCEKEIANFSEKKLMTWFSRWNDFAVDWLLPEILQAFWICRFFKDLWQAYD